MLVSVTDPRNFVTQYQYDKAGNRTLVWDASNNKTTFAYDKLNRVTRETDPFGRAIRYAYDDAGRLVTITDRLNRIRGFGYDDANRKTSETWYTGPTINQVQTFGYDDVGNLTSTSDPDGSYTLTYDAANRVATESGPYGLTRTFFYDEAGNRYLVTDNKGGTESSTYDLADRLTGRTLTAGGQSAEVTLTYTDRGELETETRTSGGAAAGSTKYLYNDDGQVSHITHKDAAGEVVADYSYLYDLAGRLTNKTENGVATPYDYDAAGQLILDGNNNFTYDATGNRTMPGYGTSTGNRITSDGEWSFGYDNAGRVTSRTKTGEVWAYVYDHRGSLISATKRNGVGVVEGVVSYKYDAWGNLIRRTETGLNGTAVSDERYAVDGWDTAKMTPVGNEQFDTWADVDASGNVLNRWLFGAGFDDVVARLQGGVVSWYGTDRQGSVRQVFDNSGGIVASSDFDAWGNVTAGALTDRYGFTGLDWDGFTRLWMPANGRPYDADIGRWLAGDEKGFEAGDVNLSRYVGNGPTNGVDPSGYWLYIPEGDASKWQRYEAAGYINLIQEWGRPGYLWVTLNQKGREGNTFHNLVVDQLRPVFNDETVLQEAMRVIFNGEVANANPNYDSKRDDRLLSWGSLLPVPSSKEALEQVLTRNVGVAGLPRPDEFTVDTRSTYVPATVPSTPRTKVPTVTPAFTGMVGGKTLSEWDSYDPGTAAHIRDTMGELTAWRGDNLPAHQRFARGLFDSTVEPVFDATQPANYPKLYWTVVDGSLKWQRMTKREERKVIDQVIVAGAMEIDKVLEGDAGAWGNLTGFGLQLLNPAGRTSNLQSLGNVAKAAASAKDARLLAEVHGALRVAKQEQGIVRAGFGETGEVFRAPGELPHFSIGRANSALAGDLGELGTYGENIANNPAAARLHRRLIDGGYQHSLDFGPVIYTDDGLVIYGQMTRSPRQITVFARAHDDGTAILGTFGHEARHGVDALRGLPLGTRWSEFRAHLQDFVVTRGRYPTATEAQDLASQVLQNYRHLPANNMDGLLRQIAVTGHGN